MDAVEKFLKDHSLSLEEYRELLGRWQEADVREVLISEAVKLR